MPDTLLRNFLAATLYQDEDSEPAGPQGKAYEALAARSGIPCPAELVVLGDALTDARIIAGAWELLAAEAAESSQAALGTLVSSTPCLRPRANMLPLFTRDGDLLLLGADGAVRLFQHESWEYDYGLVATSIDELLVRLLKPEPIETNGLGFHAWITLDDILYSYRVSHVCSVRSPQYRAFLAPGACATLAVADLQPHARRVDGKAHPFEILFSEEVLTLPRSEPVGIVATSSGPLDLRVAQLGTRIIEWAIQRGWSGRDQGVCVEDGRGELAQLLVRR